MEQLGLCPECGYGIIAPNEGHKEGCNRINSSFAPIYVDYGTGTIVRDVDSLKNIYYDPIINRVVHFRSSFEHEGKMGFNVGVASYLNDAKTTQPSLFTQDRWNKLIKLTLHNIEEHLSMNNGQHSWKVKEDDEIPKNASLVNNTNHPFGMNTVKELTTALLDHDMNSRIEVWHDNKRIRNVKIYTIKDDGLGALFG